MDRVEKLLNLITVSGASPTLSPTDVLACWPVQPNGYRSVIQSAPSGALSPLE